MRIIKQSETTAIKRRVYFHIVGVDGITPATSEAGGQPQISTNGGAWADVGISVLTAIGNGRYYAELTAAAVGTIGDLIETRYKSAVTAECPGDSVQVYANDPAISTFDSQGGGSSAFTYTVTDANLGTPIADVTVWVTSDVNGATILAVGATNSNGQAIFMLEPGTIYVWRQKSGYAFANPDIEQVV